MENSTSLLLSSVTDAIVAEESYSFSERDRISSDQTGSLMRKKSGLKFSSLESSLIMSMKEPVTFSCLK